MDWHVHFIKIFINCLAPSKTNSQTLLLIKRIDYTTPMVKNINCKKKWYPSRHETTTRLAQAMEKKRMIAEEADRIAEEEKNKLCNSDTKRTGGRSSWML